MVELDKQGHMITSGSYTGSGNDKDVNEDGLPYNHGFSIMHVFEVVDGKDQKHRLVQLRNPWGWGKEKFHGAWSDSSKLWTEDLLK